MSPARRVALHEEHSPVVYHGVACLSLPPHDPSIEPTSREKAPGGSEGRDSDVPGNATGANDDRPAVPRTPRRRRRPPTASGSSPGSVRWSTRRRRPRSRWQADTREGRSDWRRCGSRLTRHCLTGGNRGWTGWACAVQHGRGDARQGDGAGDAVLLAGGTGSRREIHCRVRESKALTPVAFPSSYPDTQTMRLLSAS